ncbi:MAG: 6,7-dimethyl-8-ribityllumazine synthase [Ignavibacteria bacterium]|nr:6,7-dimethyl-8-ribityllumazine synthase [Ignavibacteria bacterium]
MSTSAFQTAPVSFNSSNKRIAIVVARWNPHITEALLSGCRDGLLECGISERNIQVVHCPGSFEIPVIVKHLLINKDVDGIIAIGVIIRGETAHFEYVAEPVSHALQTLAIEEGIPIGFCVLTTNNEQQALDRAGAKYGNKGYEVALSTLETIQAIDKISDSQS